MDNGKDEVQSSYHNSLVLLRVTPYRLVCHFLTLQTHVVMGWSHYYAAIVDKVDAITKWVCRNKMSGLASKVMGNE